MHMTEIVQGTTKKPASAQRLADFFAANDFGGVLYIGYPIIGTADGPYPIDALWISPEHGVVIVNLIEGKNLARYKEEQDDAFNKLEARFRLHRELNDGRKLAVEMRPLTFAPAVPNAPNFSDGEHLVCDAETLPDMLEGFDNQYPQNYSKVLAVVQAISSIRKTRRRSISRPGSLGSRLKELEDSIANLDSAQSRAVIETADGVQRIRGLAGSGKTIVLALKAAYLHAQHPDWRIAITFQTRSLKGQFGKLIKSFVIEQTGEEPNWEGLQILHAWGAPGAVNSRGIYYLFCLENGITYRDFNSAKSAFGSKNAFKGACREALREAADARPIFDAVLVDEAQDFPPEFLRICYRLLGEKKRMVYAYDELQNLTEESLPSPDEIFGLDDAGNPIVSFEREDPSHPERDLILEKCYRNSRPVLTTAHSLGFGIYREEDPKTGTGLVQMFEQKELWHEIGYEIKSGALEDGERVRLGRTELTSPRFLEGHSPLDELIQFIPFESSAEQADWISSQIQKNLDDDELRVDDIIVINPDPFSTRSETGAIRKRLYERGVGSHLAGVDTSPDIFFDGESETVAFTGIYRAKGNEAGMVYIMNAQDCYSAPRGNATARNRLFTAITRSKAWVRVCGLGADMKLLEEEFTKTKTADFELDFTYPDADQRAQIKIVNRDITGAERARLERNKQSLSAVLRDLASGRIRLEDLDVEQVERLRTILGE